MTAHPFPGQALLGWLEPLLPLEQWIPERYWRYTPLIQEGLAFFLAHLPQERLDALAHEQLAMADADMLERLVSLMRQCPVLHKLAQVLAHDQRLEASVRAQLMRLETLPSNLDAADGQILVRRELGSAVGVEVDAPLAEASVAAVFPYRTITGEHAREGVLKLLKPNVEQRLAEDLAHWPELSAFLEERAARHGLEALQYRATLNSVASLLRAELRLDAEQAHLQRAARLYDRSPNIKVPALHPRCTPRMTAMERIDGHQLADVPPGSARARELAGRLLDGLFVEPLVDAPESPIVHGDPHPGNLRITDDGRIAVFDWALAAEPDASMRQDVARLIMAAACLDGRRLRAAVQALGQDSADPGALRTVSDTAVRTLRWGHPLDADWLLEVLDAAATQAHTYFPEPLIILRKSLQMAFGVCSDLVPRLRPGVLLSREAMARLATAVGSGRAPPIGLQADDWLDLFLSAPLTPGRFWLGLTADLMRQASGRR